MPTIPWYRFCSGFSILLLSNSGCYPPVDEFHELDTTYPEEPFDGYNVVESEDFGFVWPCERHDSCWQDYLAFPDKARGHARPVSEEELSRLIDDVHSDHAEIYRDALPPEDLGDDLVDAMNVRFLLEGLDGRRLDVITIEHAVDEGYTVRRLLFRDEFVGTFEGILLIPDGPGPFPGVVAIHGHYQDAAMYIDKYHGSAYPENGYALLALSMRADRADWVESLVTTTLLLEGFTFMALRSYETMLALKFLRYLPEVAPDRIALIGHSGGSVASNLTIRIEPGFSAYSSDCRGIYVNGGIGGLIDETAPDVFPYHELVNDFSTSLTPILDVPYDHAATSDGFTEILDFFDDSV